MTATIDEVFQKEAARRRVCRICGETTDRMFRLMVQLREVQVDGKDGRSVSKTYVACEQHAPVMFERTADYAAQMVLSTP